MDKGVIVQSIARALTEGELQDAVRRATGDRARLRLRIKRMAGALTESGLHLKTPADVQL